MAVIDVIEEENLVEHSEHAGGHLMAKLEKLQQDFPEIADVRGKGLMLGMEIVDDNFQADGDRAGKLLEACEERNLLMLRCGADKNVVSWLPPLIVSYEQIDEATEIFKQALEATA